MKLAEKLGFVGSTISVFGIAFGWGIFPWFLKLQIGKIKGLVPGTESRDFWERIPFALDFKVYIFNVTNHLAVQENSEMPEVEEIGPYYYYDWKDKTELVDYKDDDSVSFYMRDTYYFNPEKSKPLRGDEMVIVPHPILVGLILGVERDKAGVIPLVNKAIPILFNKPDSIFLKTKVQDLLFGGIVFNCTTKDFAASAVCAVLKKETTYLEKITPSVFKFSFLNMAGFHLRNATNDPNKYQVNRGIKDYSKVGQMITLNGKKRLPYWRGRPCNNLEGTDGTVFPSDISSDQEIVSFHMELCRSIVAKYVRKSEYKSIPSLRYNVSLGDMSTDPALKCLCTNETACWKKGVMDLMRCSGIPVIGSLPHFYDAHEDYKNGVRGLKPNAEDHGIYLDIEPMTGTPLFAKKRIQFSFPLHKVNKIEISSKLPQVLLPFMWVEEALELPDHLVDKINSELFRVLKFLDILKWAITILGAAVVSGGVGLYYKEQNARPITPSSETSRKSSLNGYDNMPKNTTRELGHTNLGYIN